MEKTANKCTNMHMCTCTSLLLNICLSLCNHNGAHKSEYFMKIVWRVNAAYTYSIAEVH